MPKELSFNSNIQKEELEKVKMSSAGEFASALIKSGHGAVMSKFDLVAAYKQVPCKIEDLRLQGFMWLGKFFCETRQIFGARIHRYVFPIMICSLVSGAIPGLTWILCRLVYVKHYKKNGFFRSQGTAISALRNETQNSRVEGRESVRQTVGTKYFKFLNWAKKARERKEEKARDAASQRRKLQSGVEWARLESKEKPGGVPALTPVYKYRSLMADRIRMMLETPRGVGRQAGDSECQAVQLVWVWPLYPCPYH
jgi:hypothetical protein